MLGKKKTVKNQEWVEMHKIAGTLLSREHMKRLEHDTIEEILKTTNGLKSAYAWSGGKDSLPLSKICEKAGINKSVLGICNLEYEIFMDWIQKNKPEGLTIVNTKQDLEWLARNPHMLFPETSADHMKWYSIVQHRAQREYFHKENLGILILGRRKKDGNFVGKNNMSESKGVLRYSPLSEWTHEEVSAYIQQENLAMPPIYDWDNGFVQGTHPWPARQRNISIKNTWSEIYTIDKRIVLQASKVIESAKKYLEGLSIEAY